MAKINRLIPFVLTPQAWLLSGTAREIAKAAYYNDGRDFELAQAEIVCRDDPTALAASKININARYGDIDPYDAAVQIANLLHSGVDLEIALVEAAVEHGKMTKKAGEKETATLRGQPWFGMIDDGYDPDQGISGFYFECDWNRYWIDELAKNGYYGSTEEIIIEQWFADICRAQGAEAIPMGSDFSQKMG